MRIACCSVVLGVAGLLAACDGQPLPPTAPSQFTTGGSPPLTYVLSGKVTEMTAAGPTPVANALVREMLSGQFGTTDAEGRYQIDRVSLVSATTTIAASKIGYITHTITRAITGDTTVDIELRPQPGYPVPPSVFLAEATLSGTVYERVGNPSQPVGIEGVSVYCEQCGESTHNFALTDSTGAYVFPPGFWTEGRPTFPARVSARKDGYTDPPGRPSPTPPNPTGAGWREVVIDGDTRFDIELVRR